jgi:hypothetical protein
MSQKKLLHRFMAGLLLSFGLVLLSLMLVTGISSGQGLGWTSPSRISAKGQTSWFPDVAVDQAGTVHVVWASGVPDYGLVYHAEFHQDGTRLEPLEIRALFGESGEVTRPTLFADNQGMLHLTYRDTRLYYSNVNASQAHTSKAWSVDQLISEGYFSDVVVDSQGRLHYFFTRNVITGACPICYHVFYIYSDDGGNTWSKETDISRGPLGAAKPQILVDKNDNLHLVYEAGIGGSYGQLTDSDPTQVMYLVSYDNGLNWEYPVQLNPGEMDAKNITIGMDGQGKLVVVWWNVNDDAIYYQISRELRGDWSLPYRLPDVIGVWSEIHSRLDSYSMETDSEGNLHLVLVGRPSDNVEVTPEPSITILPGTPTLTPSPTPTPTKTPTPTLTPTGVRPTPDERIRLNLYYMAWRGDTWSKPEILAAYAGDVPEWPRIDVGLGNQLHVVWFVRAERDVWAGGGDYTIWYTSKTLNTPKYTPAAYPTLKPIEATEVVQEIVETPTPTPMMDLPEAIQKPAWQLIYNEMDYLTVAVLSALPVVFFVGIFALIIRKLKR